MRSESDTWSVFSPLMVVGQIAERVGQLVGRGGPLDRDRVRQLAFAARDDFEDLGAEQALGLDRRLGALTEADAVSTSKVTSTRAPSSSMLDTSPTRKPDTCTGAPAASPPASAK